MSAPRHKENPFKKAIAHKLKLKLLLMGESGTGKTWWALSLATRLCDLEGGKIAFIDTEGADGKAQLYAPYFEFDHMIITDRSPESYINAIRAASQFGYTIVIVDSFTPGWNGTGGIIQIADTAKMGWAEAKPRHQRLIDCVHDATIHIIGTARVKDDFAKTETGDIDWKNSTVKARQDSEFEYEWDMSAILDHDHNLTLRKSRCFDLKSGMIVASDEEQTQFMFQLNTWLNAGDTPPHWTENPRQNERADRWIEKARDLDKYALYIADGTAEIERKEFDTPEAYVEALKDYCSPEAVIERTKAKTLPKSGRDLGALPKLTVVDDKPIVQKVMDVDAFIPDTVKAK